MFRPLKESTAQQPSSPPPPPPTTTTTTTSGVANKKKDIIDQNTTQAELEPLRNKGVSSDQQQYTQLQRVEINSNSNVNGHCLSQSNSASFHQNNVKEKIRFFCKLFSLTKINIDYFFFVIAY